MKKNIFPLVICLMMMVSCEKTTHQQDDINNSSLTFWSKTSFGSVSIKVDNQQLGTLSTYSAVGVTCGSGGLSTDIAEGLHTYSAVSSTGKTWSGSINIGQNECRQIEFISSGVVVPPPATNNPTYTTGILFFTTCAGTSSNPANNIIYPVTVTFSSNKNISACRNTIPNGDIGSLPFWNTTAGDKTFTARDQNGHSWSGTITVVQNRVAQVNLGLAGFAVFYF